MRKRREKAERAKKHAECLRENVVMCVWGLKFNMGFGG
jgi:hypothetical protein